MQVFVVLCTTISSPLSDCHLNTDKLYYPQATVSFQVYVSYHKSESIWKLGRWPSPSPKLLIITHK